MQVLLYRRVCLRIILKLNFSVYYISNFDRQFNTIKTLTYYMYKIIELFPSNSFVYEGKEKL